MATEAAYVDFTEGSAPANPASGVRRVYAKSDGMYERDDGGSETGPLGAGGGGSGIAEAGWVDTAETWTYGSADDPTYTATVSGDLTTKYSAGMRVRVSQSTGGTKYFIITKVAHATGTTTLTLYGGTDYDLANETISSPHYSVVKAPFGFPLDPAKWTHEFTDTNQRTQATPSASTWYNIGTSTLAIPIGCWRVYYEVNAQWVDTSLTDDTAVGHKVTLSTANNSESDLSMSARNYTTAPGGATGMMTLCHRERFLTLTSKTSYYLNSLVDQANIDAINFRGDHGTTVIRAVCAYL